MAQTQKSAAPAPQQTGYTIRKKDRNWMVVDPAGQLVCITVYRKARAGGGAAAGGVESTKGAAAAPRPLLCIPARR